jgi:hypothetical protein
MLATFCTLIAFRYFPAGLQSYAVSRRGFKPATHCEPSMVVHLPVESASGSNPFLTPPVRRLAPRQLSRYVPLPSAASEGHRIYHAARTPTQSKLAADILPVSAAQLQNELIDSHLTMSNGTPVASQAISGLDSTNPSAESHAENQSVLPGNDSLVSSRHEVSKVKIHDTGATKSDPEMVYIDEPLSEDSAQFVHDVSVISDELMADKQAVMGCDARTNISSRVRDEPQTSDYMKNVAVSITLLDELELEKRHPENIVVKETASAKSNIDGDHETVDIAMAGRAEPITAESRGIVSVSMAAVEEPFSVDSIPMTNVNVAVSVADDSDDFAITVKVLLQLHF